MDFVWQREINGNSENVSHGSIRETRSQQTMKGEMEGSNQEEYLMLSGEWFLVPPKHEFKLATIQRWAWVSTQSLRWLEKLRASRLEWSWHHGQINRSGLVVV